ncbi:hypothetical protein NDN08_005652 [Rhodosorus marinus]|uniref:Metallo-beta-lactamase domain-containing protein n=1 Tax=Rhodosorus marinus TaxID=101924 RepID=A0AAV8V507_9RHOD|nr:hypothetical protein NDN08_005652 [Rhodosorus marinus]
MGKVGWRLISVGNCARAPSVRFELSSFALLTRYLKETSSESGTTTAAEEESMWVIDAGDNMMGRLMEESWCGLEGLRRLKGIFITHLHGDHVFGLPSLLSAVKRAGGKQKVTIIGPSGMRKWLNPALWVGAPDLGVRYRILELQYTPYWTRNWNFHPSESGYKIVSMSDDGKWDLSEYIGTDHFEVKAAPLRHGIPSLGFVFQKPGRKLVVLGDTCDSSAVESIGKDCDVLVHEATFTKSEAQIAQRAKHSTAEMAGNFAKKIGAKTLLLTHFSSRWLKDNQQETFDGVRLSLEDPVSGLTLRNVQKINPYHGLTVILNEAKEAFGSESLYAASRNLEIEL